jgi:hypothetical protein
MLTVGCDRWHQRGLDRRDFLRIGTLGPLALSWAAYDRARASTVSGAGAFGRARRCILVFLNGGPSHLDLWDMKPDAPSEVRGELNSIATSTPGIRISELWHDGSRTLVCRWLRCTG